jgi:hypothetical protein
MVALVAFWVARFKRFRGETQVLDESFSGSTSNPSHERRRLDRSPLCLLSAENRIC